MPLSITKPTILASRGTWGYLLNVALDNIVDWLNTGRAASYAALARTPDTLISGLITRDANNAAISAPVVWPDGKPGLYTALVLSTVFPGAVDSYKITYVDGATTVTYTQPTLTRDPLTGVATNAPAITVA